MVGLVLLPALFCGLAVADDDPPPERREALPSGVVERARAHLAQIDVTVTGPPDVIADLQADDFEIRLRSAFVWRRLDDILVDRFCEEPSVSPVEPEALPDVYRPVSFLFYFDQPHLTPHGRVRSIEESRKLVPELIVRGNRGMVISNGREFEVLARLTSDPADLLGAIDRLESDVEIWDTAISEEVILAELDRTLREQADTHALMRGEEAARNERMFEGAVGALTKRKALRDRELRRRGVVGGGGPDPVEADAPRDTSEATSQAAAGPVLALARHHQSDEILRAERNLRRLRMALADLRSVDPPKAVVYFADTMRANAGEHYWSFLFESDSGRRLFGSSASASMASGWSLQRAGESRGAQGYFNRVIDEAAAQGIRFYTVRGEGLMPPATRRAHAGNTLTDLALETGGRAFVRGLPGDEIADRITRDFSCLYLISFDPSDLRTDVPLAVKVKVNRPKVRAHARGRVVFQSESSRLESRLLAAYLRGEIDDHRMTLSTSLVPLGYEDGMYSAILQIATPGIDYPDATWDLGASLIREDRVRVEASQRVRIVGRGVPVVVQQQVSLRPGEYRVVAVGHEAGADTIASGQGTVTWPDPNSSPASVGPIAVLQPSRAAFSRDGSVRSSGFMSRGAGEAIRVDRPTALVGLVCRGKQRRAPLRIERSLRGESEVEFAPLQIEFDDQRCAQTRDLIPAGTLGPGYFRYEVRVVDGDSELARAERVFPAVDPERIPPEPNAPVKGDPAPDTDG